MTTYTFTITATFDGADPGDAFAAFTEWLTEPRNVTEGTVVTTDADPANPDTIWHGLTLAAKADWVRAMQPEPPVLSDGQARHWAAAESLPPLTSELLAKVYDRYLDVVRGNTGPTWDATLNVFEAIRLNGQRSPNTGEYAGNHWEITDELGVIAHDVPEIAAIMPDYDTDPDWHDAFTDQLRSLLPTIESALEADLNERNPA